MSNVITHYGNDPMGAPTQHNGLLENCPAPECQDCVAEQAVDDGPTMAQATAAALHAEMRHPDFEYRTTEGPRKQWDDVDTPPADENGDPDPSWERNVDAGRDGWERWDYTEESYWRRRKADADRTTEK